MKKSNIILTDVDGVLLDWFSAFRRYMKTLGLKEGKMVHTDHDKMYKFFGLKDNDEMFEYVEVFNSGHWEFGTLPALDLAVDGVNALHSVGYRFVAITSCSTAPQAVALRKANLYNIFGDVFDEVHCVDVGESKRTHLADYEPTFWIEDKASAAEDGLDYGHNSILIAQTWNAGITVDNRIKRCYDWREIENYILKGE